MLTIQGTSQRVCNGLTRRDVIRAAGTGLLGQIIPLEIPGWQDHGARSGIGQGTAETDGTQSFLRLSAGGSFRTHNWLYVPGNAALVEFQYERGPTTANPALPDVLQVRMGDRVLGRLRLDASAASSGLKTTFDLPSDVRGTIQTLTFEIVPSDRTVRSEVRIDDVKPDMLELAKRPAFISDLLAEETLA